MRMLTRAQQFGLLVLLSLVLVLVLVRLLRQ